MGRGPKIVLGVLLLVTLAAGYGVYWWHESALDDQVAEGAPSEWTVEQATGIRAQILAPDFREKSEGLRRIQAMEEIQRASVLVELAEDTSAQLRMIVTPMLGKLKDRYPQVRAELVKLALTDPEKEVREQAREALGGGGPP